MAWVYGCVVDLDLGFGWCFVFWVTLWIIVQMVGGAFVFCGFGSVDVLGGLRNGVQTWGG